MAYDGARRRIVLFGGEASLNGNKPVALGDTWEWDGTQWTMTDGGGPSRSKPAMAYDPARGKTVVFGGLDPTTMTYFGDTWEYAGAGWVANPAAGPTPRVSAMAWYAQGEQIVLFGGTSGTGTSSDMWTFDGTSWSGFATGAPVRGQHAMAGDVAHGYVLAVGGDQATDLPWEYDGQWYVAGTASPSTSLSDRTGFVRETARGKDLFVSSQGAFEMLDGAWSRVASDPTASQQTQNAMVYDEAHAVALLYQPTLQATWIFDGAWKAMAKGPAFRTAPALAYDGVNGQVVMFGGLKQGAMGSYQETWAWNGTAWHMLSPAHQPPPRFDAAFAWDPVRREAVLFGGKTFPAGLPFGDTWAWDGADWTERVPATAPTRRSQAAFAWNPNRRRLLLYAGSDTSGLREDAWEWDGASWSLVPVPNAPPPRSLAALAASSDGKGVVMFGGQDPLAGGLNDQWLLSWDSDNTDEICTRPEDADGDGLVGCADGDCWPVCSLCGDGICELVENSWMCPADCSPPAPAICGDGFCDGEQASCPGDCP